MKTLPLQRGLTTMIDDADYQALSQFRWFATGPGSCGTRYAYRTVRCAGKNKNIRLHRELLQAPAGLDVDHVNGDGLDNRRGNLRLATRAQNARNQTHKAANKTSRFKGVSWDKRLSKWRANIMLNRKNIHLGSFTEEMDARAAYARKAVELFGDFAAPAVDR